MTGKDGIVGDVDFLVGSESDEVTVPTGWKLPAPQIQKNLSMHHLSLKQTSQ